ncbi:hypothetical protein [Halobaculum sp. MBLA0143]|uniref:hypothetical protein n=1 Tax=Halobaculum sp. MBLA0143 TaxID=3079933 RepID=UPI0035267FF0
MSPSVPPARPRVTLTVSLGLVAVSLGLQALGTALFTLPAVVAGLGSFTVAAGWVEITSDDGPSEGWRALGIWLLLAVGVVAVLGQVSLYV